MFSPSLSLFFFSLHILKRGTQGNPGRFRAMTKRHFQRVLRDASTLQLNVTTSVSKRARRKEHSEMFACEKRTSRARNSDREDLFLITREDNFHVQSFSNVSTSNFMLTVFRDFLIFVTRDGISKNNEIIGRTPRSIIYFYTSIIFPLDLQFSHFLIKFIFYTLNYSNFLIKQCNPTNPCSF